MCTIAVFRRVSGVVVTQVWFLLLLGALQEISPLSNPVFGKVRYEETYPYSGSGDGRSDMNIVDDSEYSGSGDGRSDMNIVDDSEAGGDRPQRACTGEFLVFAGSPGVLAGGAHPRPRAA
ncbi:uncharacterized protein LOC134774740 [Penaeus indicus]|uniref:uncharacterized protein LOC134774740 n=1 Tax=Penaeus indicus TaxID=29960 RepID=UPI00300C4BA7